MSRRRRRDSSEDSLELLLDTITNAFGGIVFLALLIVLIAGKAKLTDSNNSQQASAARRYEEAVRQLRETQNQTRTIKQALQTSESLAKEFGNSETQSQVQELIKLENQASHLDGQLESAKRTNSQVKEKLKSLAEEISDTDKLVSQRKSEVDDKQAELKSEKEKRTISSALPKERITRKRQAVFLVKNDRLYVLHKDRTVADLSINLSHFESALHDADINLSSAKGGFKVKRNAGIPLSDEAAIETEIARYDQARVYVAIAIWEDSFAEFSSLRKSCLSKSLEYSLIPLPAGETIYESSSARAPKVQ